jgi:hypothetical protein
MCQRTTDWRAGSYYKVLYSWIIRAAYNQHGVLTMGSSEIKTGQTPMMALAAGRPYRPVQAFHWQLLLAMVLMVVIAPGSAAGQQTEDLDSTVQHLITYVKESEVFFERNTSRYSGSEAAKHINKKYQHFKDEIDTVEKFIELCATGSLMTGKPYFIITEQGEQLPSSEWLNSELQSYRLRNQSTGH